MKYPKWKYHKTLDPVLVSSEEDEAKLGDAWADSPSAFGVITCPTAEQAIQLVLDKAKADADTLAAADAAASSKKSK